MLKRFIRPLMAAVTLLPGFAASTRCANLPPIKTVFLIVMENEDWQNVQNSSSAPYLNQTLLPISSYCSQYFNPPGIHPSLPNYLWLESGTNFGILDDNDPASDHQSTPNHLVTLLNNAGVSWKAYEEDIPGTNVPLSNYNGYTVRHDPFVYFDDVTGTNNPIWPYAIAHIRPYTEFMSDLASNTVAQYNFLGPDICDDGHNTCAPLNNNIRQGDAWLSTEIPKITNSLAYQNNGAIFIAWDENNYDNQPVGLLLLSPLAKGGGYVSTNYYTHSSTLRTFQEIFAVTPLLRDAANAADLSDLFVPPNNPATNGFRVSGCVKLANGAFTFTVTGATPGATNLIQSSTDLSIWTTISTIIPTINTFTITDTSATNASRRFYRVLQFQ